MAIYIYINYYKLGNGFDRLTIKIQNEDFI